MKIFYYFTKYAIIMIIGQAVDLIGITSFYQLPFLLIIAYNWIAIYFGIKLPLEKNKDINYKELLLPLIILGSVLNVILLYWSNCGLSTWLLLSISTIIGLIVLKPRQEEQIEKNIKEYFENKKK